MTVDDTQHLFGLKRSTLNKFRSVFQVNDAIESMRIYGSCAKGSYYRVGLDIDLTIKGRLLLFLELMQIEYQIDDLYLPYMIDLSQYEKLTNIRGTAF